jgi:hypothetical protein
VQEIEPRIACLLLQEAARGSGYRSAAEANVLTNPNVRRQSFTIGCRWSLGLRRGRNGSGRGGRLSPAAKGAARALPIGRDDLLAGKWTGR